MIKVIKVSVSAELKEWVRVAAGRDRIDRYTIEQLRAVKKILEG